MLSFSVPFSTTAFLLSTMGLLTKKWSACPRNVQVALQGAYLICHAQCQPSQIACCRSIANIRAAQASVPDLYLISDTHVITGDDM